MHAVVNGRPVPTETQTVVVYDPSTGRVAHLHQAFAVANARKLDPAETERDALVRAQQRGHQVDKLKTLVLREPLPTGKSIRVDVASGQLVTTAFDPFAARKRP